MIRELRDADVPAVVDLLDELYPEWLHDVDDFRHRLATTPERARTLRLVAVEDGDVVGSAMGRFDLYSGRDDVAFLWIAVREGYRGRGIGSALYDETFAHLVRHGARRLLAESKDEDSARRFAGARGFRHTMTRRLSSLDPRSLDTSAFDELRRAREGEGFRVVPMSDFRDRPQAIHAIDAETSRDIPLDQPATEIDYDDWRRAHWESRLLSLEGSSVVAHDGRPISFAMISAQPSRGKAENAMTGTLREFRGRGLARLAKLRSIRWAAANGIAQIVTENDETNAPMLALNTSLGYGPFAAQLAYVRDLE